MELELTYCEEKSDGGYETYTDGTYEYKRTWGKRGYVWDYIYNGRRRLIESKSEFETARNKCMKDPTSYLIPKLKLLSDKTWKDNQGEYKKESFKYRNKKVKRRQYKYADGTSHLSWTYLMMKMNGKKIWAPLDDICTYRWYLESPKFERARELCKSRGPISLFALREHARMYKIPADIVWSIVILL